MTDHDDMVPGPEPQPEPAAGAATGGTTVEDALRPTEQRLRQVLSAGQMRPAFRDRLRADMVAARAQAIAAGAVPAVGTAPVPAVGTAPVPARGRTQALVERFRRPRWRPVRIAWAAGGVTAAAVATAVVLAGVLHVTGRPPVGVTVRSGTEAALSADPAAALRLTFSQPMDHAATAAALRLVPATEVRPSWQGDVLTVMPVHGFAANSAYVLTVDRGRARTATGAALTADLHLVFGTAPAPVTGAGPVAAEPALDRTPVAGADQGSEAVVARDGALLLTGARPGPGTGDRGGLVRIRDGGSARLSAATDAICVSRSGASIAYLTRGDTGTRVVLADATGTASAAVTVTVDPGSPLGWIDDAQVSFVGGGRLRAVDRAGQVRALAGVTIDPAHDTVVLAPGGRYAYVRPAAGGTGRVIDLTSGVDHPLPVAVDTVAFSPDGATVAWFTAPAGGTAELAVAASSGGPVLLLPVPVRPGEQLSDLALSPDGATAAYSLTGGGSSELRLAALADGRTLAVSPGAGQSPNWSPSGRWFTVLTAAGGAARIDTVAVPQRVPGDRAALAGAVAAFARAQAGSDTAAARALSQPGIDLPALPGVTRAAVLWALPAAGGGGTARVRLTADARPGAPQVGQSEETVVFAPAPSGGTPLVRSVTATALATVPPGPQLLRLDTDTVPGAVRLVFDSDLDPATVPGCATLLAGDGTALATVLSYDPGSRTVTLRPAHPGPVPAAVRLDPGPRDIDGHAPPATGPVPLRPGG